MGIQTLLQVDEALRMGAEPEENFNISSMAFLVKGDNDHDAIAVLRDPLSTRSLCMKNTDHKIIVSANCSALSHTAKKLTHRAQNGFTGGGNFLNNLVALVLLVACTP